MREFDYKKAVAVMAGLVDFERVLGNPCHKSFRLDRMAVLLREMGNPHLHIPSIHVAGTDGKGSTSAMVASVLSCAGYKVGLYTSPHLHEVTERIRVGIQPIAPNDFATLVEEVWSTIEEVGQCGGYGGITFFEAMTALAFLYFQRIGADVQVVEVGMGGRLDATNLVVPEVSIITPISLDHVSMLGDTLAKIATEKAGIIKSEVPVVVAPQPEDAMKAILRTALSKKAEVISICDLYDWQITDVGVGGQSFNVCGRGGQYSLHLSLLGDYQVENAVTAIAAVETMREKGFPIPAENISGGIRSVAWSARFEILSYRGRTIVVDGAHNLASAQRLSANVLNLFGARSILLLFGSLIGHAMDDMLREFGVLDPSVIAVKSKHPKAVEDGVVANVAKAEGLPVHCESGTVTEGLEKAMALAESGAVILATGSLSVAAEVIQCVSGMTPEPFPDIGLPGKAVRSA